MLVASSEDLNLENYPKYYQFQTVTTIFEHLIDCLTDESNPYHSSLSWLTRKQSKPPMDYLSADLFKECSSLSVSSRHEDDVIRSMANGYELSPYVRSKLERCPSQTRKEIVSRVRDGCSPLFLASKNGLTKVVQYLIETCGADIEQKGHYVNPEDQHNHYVSPLWIAAVCGNFDAVKILIDHGANVNSESDSGSTPLRSACHLCRKDDGLEVEEKYFKIIRLLVENGADLKRPNLVGGTCLINSVHNYDLTKYLISKGADVNASSYISMTALHYAIKEGRIDVTKLLISNGADPTLQTYNGDDALQLCCLKGHLDIFRYLIKNIKYPKSRLIDAHKLLGSSILEQQDSMSMYVRELWEASIMMERASQDDESTKSQQIGTNVEADNLDVERRAAFGTAEEFKDERQVQTMSLDDLRIQSLLISERVIGRHHREFFQRLLSRGRSYLASSRPDRCLSLWIYALNLRLKHETILHFECITTIRALCTLVINLVSQNSTIKYDEIYEILGLLMVQLNECKKLLSFRPVNRVHLEISDVLLLTIRNLMVSLQLMTKSSEEKKRTFRLVRDLVEMNPCLTSGTPLMNIFCQAGIQDLGAGSGEMLRMLKRREQFCEENPVISLIDALIDNGIDLEVTNNEGLSVLQTICLTNHNLPNRNKIIKHLAQRGAHIDRRAPSSVLEEQVRASLVEAGINQIQYITLACLAARKLMENKSQYPKDICGLPEVLEQILKIH